LLYLALLELRQEAYANGNKKIFHLADLFHNIPLQLERVSNGEGSYDEVLTWLEKRAVEKNCSEWLNTAINSETMKK
ncbi:MAG: hypothetical protein M3362_26720, partial [Acidobacteriota bacterium]|nr:hypothetical protein [Acidobacteriota bacterium]